MRFYGILSCAYVECLTRYEESCELSWKTFPTRFVWKEQIGSVRAPVSSRQREADYEACACSCCALSFYRSAVCIDDPF
jgi:hypothetical protein